MTFYEMILQSEFLAEIFITVGACFLIWALFWGCAMIRKFFFWRERSADDENGKGAE